MKLKLFTLPNAVTCLNLISGCVAVERAFAGDFLLAFLFVAAAAVFDFLDGFCARLLKSYSEVGKQLDSLADMVSFGAAPAFVLFNYLRGVPDISGWEPYLVFVVAAFSALRLAKFNLDERQSTEFIGLPTPANALLIVSMVFSLSSEAGVLIRPLWLSWVLIGSALVLSVLLVSEIRMFSLKFKSFGWRGNEIRYVFLILSLLLLVLFGLYAVPCILLLYILLSILWNVVCRK
jgi:CDP-diacylglycerol--serine O-phosphatidyltransferase